MSGELLIVEVPGPTQYVTKDVHIHRAPTDESVKLLKEMEEKAEAKVIESVRLEGNGFECVIHTHRDCMSDQTVYRVVFALNGKRCTVEYAASRDKDPVAAAPEIAKLVSEKIAQEMLPPAFSALMNSTPYRQLSQGW